MNIVLDSAPAVTSCATCGDLLEPDVVHGAHNRLYTIQVHAYNHWCAEYGRQGWLVTLDRLANGGEPCVVSWYATAHAFHRANQRLSTGGACDFCGLPSVDGTPHPLCIAEQWTQARAEVA